MSLTEPIVEGAYYVDRDGVVLRFGKVLTAEFARDAGFTRVHLVPTDPEELVAELRRSAASLAKSDECGLPFTLAADLVAKKLGVEE